MEQKGLEIIPINYRGLKVAMELIAFRVSMYKGIIDSGWVDVNDLTVLVGKNESGKTSLLKALHKLNPYNQEPYEITNEWPRGHRDKRDEKHVVCQARFQLSEKEKSKLREIGNTEKIPNIVQASRNYAGQLEINFAEVSHTDTGQSKIDFEEDFFAIQAPTVETHTILSDLPKADHRCSDEFKKCAADCLNEVKRLANEGQFIALKQLAQKHEPLLRDIRTQQHDYSFSFEGQFINGYLEALNQLAEKTRKVRTPLSEARQFIRDHLPTFIYMDEYKAFSGNAYLKDVQSRKKDGRLTEADKTFLTILYLSNLNLDELVTSGQGNEEQIEQRQYDLDDGAAALTETISDRFRQRRYEVDYRSDGQNFFTYVKDDHNRSLIRLEERSKGFQWFFSFDLTLMHETKGTFKGCVILLDEPGLHLHPKAQEDLLSRLNHYAQGNQLLYTTHLPFMIDLGYPERIRVLKETDNNGTVVTTKLTESPPEAKLVLQAALGVDASQSFLVAKRNLVVEGVDDYWILTKLSNLLKQNENEGLPEDVFITPGGGASIAVHIATFMIGQNLDVVALFDSDDEGRREQERLDHNWLTQYNQTQSKTILLGDAVGADGNFALEDLFTDDFYLERVKETYQELGEITLQGEDMLWNRVNRALKKMGIDNPNKESVAKRLRDRISKMKDLNELPEETKDKAIKLFQAIRKAFGEEETGAS